MHVSAEKATVTDSRRETLSIFPVGQRLLFVLVTTLFFLWGMSNNSRSLSNSPSSVLSWFRRQTF
jgi:hypothetical protein